MNCFFAILKSSLTVLTKDRGVLTVQEANHLKNAFFSRYKSGLTLANLQKNYEKLSSYDFGVCHGDDLFLFFRQDLLGDKNEVLRTDKDQEMVKKMVTLWTSFAQNGVPNDPNWIPTTKENHKWAVINSKPIQMQFDADFEQKVEFVRTMFEVLTGYRNMKIEDHPAIQKLMEEKTEELKAEELEYEQREHADLKFDMKHEEL